MSKTTNHGKVLTAILLLFVAVGAGIGYYSFTDTVDEDKAEAATTTAAPASTEQAPATGGDENSAAEIKPAASPDALMAAQADDVLFGKAEAPVSIIDYSSLSCPHCAHFHQEVLPKLAKEFLDTGKVKLIFRHFPLNEPALRAAQLVNCAEGKQRATFINVLFEKQQDWAYTEDFLKALKQLAALGGVDGAAFDSCVTDKAGENRIMESRKMAMDAGQVNSTPTFFINGIMLQRSPTLENFRDAIKAAK